MICTKSQRFIAFAKAYLKLNRAFSSQAACKEDGSFAFPEIQEPFLKLPADVNIEIDATKSKGNFAVDQNDNVVLDLYQQDGSLPLGFNNDELLKLVKTERFQKSVLETMTRNDNRFLPLNYINLLERTLVAIAPQDMAFQHLDVKKNPLLKAIEVAGARYINNKKEVWESSYKGFSTNKSISKKCFSVLSLEGSIADSKDSPYFIQEVPFPVLNQPVDQSVSENHEEEAKCLEMCFLKIKECINAMKHPVAFVINPARYGRDTLSTNFYHILQVLCKEFGLAMIVNELDTGLGVTGKIWAHDDWGLPESPDMVVFGKKMMTSGFYMKPDYLPRMSPPDVDFSYDVTGLQLLHTLLDYICEENLFGRVSEASDVLRKELNVIQENFPNIIEGIYCNGTLCEIHFINEAVKQQADLMLLNKGLNFGRSADRMLYMRPPLIFNKIHAGYVHKGLSSVVHELNNRMADRKKSV